jgi:hypothetical protein
MRVIVTGDRAWYAPELAAEVVRRLLVRYGPELVIVHGAAPDIDWSSTQACGDLGVKVEVHPARWDLLDVPGAIIRENEYGVRYNESTGRDQEAPGGPPERRPAAWQPFLCGDPAARQPFLW